ncbi:MAG: hypothetical protein ACTSQI_09965 [Candidatus Helarchaeota archaeon]
MEDKETIIQRVINFLYDALDRFQDTMTELNQNVSALMGSLEKARGDLSGTGITRTGTDRSAVLSTISKRGAVNSSSSREKLIALLSGKPIAPAAPAAASRPPTRPAAAPPRPPVAGPPSAAAPPRPPVAGPPSAAAPPRPPVAGPPSAAAPPRPPVAGPPSAAAPPRPPVAGPPTAGPPAAAPPRPPVAPPPTAGPVRPAAPAAAGTPTISGLRDEMLKELKRLKAIMKGEK